MAIHSITRASHHGESHRVLGQTQPSQGRSDNNDQSAGPFPVLTLSHYWPLDRYSLKVTLTSLHAQTTNDKCYPLQFYKTASLPWYRDENFINHCVEQLQLAFHHLMHWTWPVTQDSIHHTSHPVQTHKIHFPNAASLGHLLRELFVEELTKLRVKTSRTKNTDFF